MGDKSLNSYQLYSLDDFSTPQSVHTKYATQIATFHLIRSQVLNLLQQQRLNKAVSQTTLQWKS